MRYFLAFLLFTGVFAAAASAMGAFEIKNTDTPNPELDMIVNDVAVSSDMSTVAVTLVDSGLYRLFVGQLTDVGATLLHEALPGVDCIEDPIFIPSSTGPQIVARRRACSPTYGRNSESFGSNLILLEVSKADTVRSTELYSFDNYAVPLGAISTPEGTVIATYGSRTYKRIGTGSDLRPKLVPVDGSLTFFALNSKMSAVSKLHTSTERALPPYIFADHAMIFRTVADGKVKTYEATNLSEAHREYSDLITALGGLESTSHPKKSTGIAKRFASSRRNLDPGTDYSWRRASVIDGAGNPIQLPFNAHHVANAWSANRTLITAITPQGSRSGRSIKFVVVDHNDDTVSEVRYLKY